MDVENLVLCYDVGCCKIPITLSGLYIRSAYPLIILKLTYAPLTSTNMAFWGP